MDILSVFSRWPRPLRSWGLLMGLLLYRVALCLTLRTGESPDEWWQSEEVAYHMVFGSGHLTWEWEEAIRSCVFPAIFAFPLWVLKSTGTDTATAVWASSRVVQAAILFAQDCTMLALAQRLDDFRGCLKGRTSHYSEDPSTFSPSSRRSTKAKCRAPTIASTTLAMLVVEWFLIHTGVRSYSNVAESLLFLLSLIQRSYPAFLFWAGLACAVRATAAFAVLPVFLMHTFRICRKKGLARGLCQVAPVTVCMVLGTIAFMCLADYMFYHRLVFTVYNFLKFNIVMDVSRFYGVHPPQWYLFVLPMMAAPFFLFLTWMPVCWSWMKVAERHHGSGSVPYALFSSTSSRTLRQEVKRWAFVGALSLAPYSAVGHKEMRFVYFLLPLLLVLSSMVVVVLCTASLPTWKCPHGVRHWPRSPVVPSAATVRRLFTLLWVVNAVFAVALVYGYRCGGPTMFRHIRGADWHFEHLEVLTHCFTTPGFAQLHGKANRLEWVSCPMKLDVLSGMREVTQDRLFTEQPKAYAMWRYLRVASRLDVEDRDMESDGKLPRDEWWREMHRLTPADEAPVLPDGIVLFQSTANLIEADVLRPMGYRRVAAVFHALYSFEPNEDRYLELWFREVAQRGEL
ncbi:hypothetical protein GH5_00128 [Leishmania sp. Ghana 2012 LV757]|uniref:hypothetical protein n=1 Tax=Leishmania sp. Ghana 2012 LV757 TaxID=2803181 RepID=UPI001B63907C|nr:hypothetical protein GH5_00128 [Leishmania sp. Ghana 2012 LV757]